MANLAAINHGLSETIIIDLQSIFAKYPRIEKIILFGSRAKGTFHSGSDIDLAVIAPDMSDAEFSRLWAEIDDLPIIFKIDLVNFNQLTNNTLKEKILREGAVFSKGSDSIDPF
jgi:predicted nucleotidyltransferase